MSVRMIGVIVLGLGMSLAACAPSTTQEPVLEVAAAEPIRETEPEQASDVANERIFAIDPELSEARFIIGEILANQPNTVIGVNNLVQGGGVFNFLEPDLSTLDEFLIDASGFETDANLRNRAIRQFILQTSQYPIIRFQPTGISGIPNEITIGELVAFEVSGLLTIREISQEVTFAGEATMVAEDRVEGLATATVRRSDFELSIPSVPRVAGVDEEFILEIEFVALAG